MIDNQVIAEHMGICWHEPDKHNPDECLKCQSAAQDENYEPINVNGLNPDFATWEGFGRCWTWAKQQEWWLDFWDWYQYRIDRAHIEIEWLEDLINPSTFSAVLAKFLKERKNDR